MFPSNTCRSKWSAYQSRHVRESKTVHVLGSSLFHLNLDSWFHSLLGFRIPRATISRILDSLTCGDISKILVNKNWIIGECNSRALIGSAIMVYLTITYEAEGRVAIDPDAIDPEGEGNDCFSKIRLVGQKFRDKTTLASKTRFSRYCFSFQSWRFSLLVGYNI